MMERLWGSVLISLDNNHPGHPGSFVDGESIFCDAVQFQHFLGGFVDRDGE